MWWCDVVSGQSVLHVLGQFGKENAAAIFDLIMEHRPQFPIDQLDANGNSGTDAKYYSDFRSVNYSIDSYS